MIPKLILGDSAKDARGKISFNNNFNALGIKRVYTIENSSADLRRGWQGHKIEKRWFMASNGQFKIDIVKINNWDNPDPKSEIMTFKIDSDGLDILFVPEGHITCIKALEENSKLIVFSNYSLNEINDEFRFDLNYFNS